MGYLFLLLSGVTVLWFGERELVIIPTLPGYWGWNPGPCTCQESTLPLSYTLQSVSFWDRVQLCFPGWLALTCASSCLSLPSCKDYSCGHHTHPAISLFIVSMVHLFVASGAWITQWQNLTNFFCCCCWRLWVLKMKAMSISLWRWIFESLHIDPLYLKKKNKTIFHLIFLRVVVLHPVLFWPFCSNLSFKLCQEKVILLIILMIT
jgi:hypothetical protein